MKIDGICQFQSRDFNMNRKMKKKKREIADHLPSVQ